MAAGPERNPEKDPQDWATGDEPMTGPQDSHLRSLTKAEASRLIEELQERTGRGAGGAS